MSNEYDELSSTKDERSCTIHPIIILYIFQNIEIQSKENTQVRLQVFRRVTKVNLGKSRMHKNTKISVSVSRVGALRKATDASESKKQTDCRGTL